MTNIWNDCPLCGTALTIANKNKYFDNFKKFVSNVRFLDTWINLLCHGCKNYLVIFNFSNHKIIGQVAIIDDLLIEIHDNGTTILVKGGRQVYRETQKWSCKYSLNPKGLLNLKSIS